MRRWILLPLAALITRGDVPDDRFRAFAATPELAPVVRIVARGRTGTGSGTLLADGVVLTAAHVVMRSPADSLEVLIGTRRYRVRSHTMHPGWNSPERVDIAVIHLAEVPAHPVATLAREAPPLPVRTVVAGYGLGGSTGRDSAGTVRAGENMIDGRGSIRPGLEGNDILSADFDVPGLGLKNATGDSLPLPLEALMTGGDSGGPLFVTEDGALRLLAVFSHSGYTLDMGKTGSSAYAGSRFAATDLTRHREWLAAQGVRLPAQRP